MKYLLPISLLCLFLASCDQDNNQLTYEEQLAIDERIIEDYLADNNLTEKAEEGEFGLRYIIEDEGTGTEYPTVSSSVIIKYKGYYPSGEVFDEKETFQTPLTSTISGWRIGIPLFKKGGKGTLFLPSSLGYGAFPPPQIVVPPNQVLIFDIEVINF